MSLDKNSAPKPSVEEIKSKKLTQAQKEGLLLTIGISIIIAALEWGLWVITHHPDMSVFVGVNMFFLWLIALLVGVVFCLAAGEQS